MIAGNHQKLGDKKRKSSLETSEGAWPSQHLDISHLDPRSVRAYISAILNPPSLGKCIMAAVGH